MPAIKIGAALTFAIVANVVVASLVRAEDAPLSEEQLVEIAIESNPQVKSARYRWDSAVHSIKQTVAPNDPIFAYTNSDIAQEPIRARVAAGVQLHRDVPVSR